MLDIKKALAVDKDLRVTYMIHIQRAIGRSLPIIFLVMGIFVLCIIFIVTNISKVHAPVYVPIIAFTGFILCFLSLMSLGVINTNLQTLSLYDTQKALSFTEIFKAIKFLPQTIIFIIVIPFIMLYELITHKKRFYIGHLAPLYMLDQNINAISAIQKASGIVIPKEQQDDLFGMGNFGYADIYRQLHPHNNK